jgi:hypothetical protein
MPSRIEVWRGDLEGPENEVNLEAMLELSFGVKSLNFGVEANLETPLELL